MKRYEDELRKLKLAYQMMLYFRIPVHPGITAKLIDVIDATYESNYGVASNDLLICRAEIYYSMFIACGWFKLSCVDNEFMMLMERKQYKEFVAYVEEKMGAIPDVQKFATESIQSI